MLQYGNVYQCIFHYFLMELFIRDFSSGWHNSFHEALIIDRITGKAGGKHIIGATQGDSMITYILHSTMCIQKVTTQYSGICDWYYKTLLCEYYIFNY